MMRFRIIILFFLLFDMQMAVGQKNYIKFDINNCKSFTHATDEVEVVDMRSDTNAILGRIRVGLMNAHQSIQTEDPLAFSIENYYLSLSKAKQVSVKKLVILLHTFFAYEDVPGFSSETAHFNFAADYFVSDDENQYRLLGMVDTNITVKSFDVTHKLMQTIDRSLCELYKSLYSNSKQQNARTYSYTEALNYENEEKKTLPAYSNKALDNAVYSTWDDFKILHNKSNESIFKKGNAFKIKYFNSKGKSKNAPAYYAKVIAYEGKLYYRIESRFYEMYKKEGDFYVAGKTMRYTDNSNVVLAGAMFGLVGGLVAGASAAGNSETYEFKINHRKGELIPIKNIGRIKRH